MKKLLHILLLCLFVQIVQASDSLYVKLNKEVYYKGDTIQINCNWDSAAPDLKNLTLQLIVQNLANGNKKTFRYPFINGSLGLDLIVGQQIPIGKYELQFNVQNAFPQLEGYVKDYQPKLKSINYLVLLKDKPAYIGTTNINEEGYFKTPKFSFPDSANILFFEAGNKRSNLNLAMHYTVDSSFTPLTTTHTIINIASQSNGKDSASIFENTYNALKTVTVKTKIKKPIELFDEANSHGLFKGGFPTIFDGIEDQSISRSVDIVTFLQSKVAGLIKKTNELGGVHLYWRNQLVTVYIDEYKVDEEFVSMINVNDIGMIKVFPPLSGGPTANGSIAIYTKRGVYATPGKQKFSYLIKGFDAIETHWQ